MRLSERFTVTGCYGFLIAELLPIGLCKGWKNTVMFRCQQTTENL
jgi:hypothetical protein